MSVRDALHALNLGSSVAEHDEALQDYFVETQTFKRVIEDDGDVIAGDKGTGKTALYRILKERYTTYEALNFVEVLPAFNPVGTPVFQRLGEQEVLDEVAYIGVWKAYILSLVGNWFLNITEGEHSEDSARFEALLVRSGLRFADDAPSTVFSALVNRVRKLITSGKGAIEGTATLDTSGMPILGARLEIDSTDEALEELSRHDEALILLNRILETFGTKAWVVFDRLDEAFQGRPLVERPALRALLRTYLDMLGLDNIRLKMFVRKDLFGRITSGGFVNLTHINARRIDITWDEDDLLDLLHRRVMGNKEFVAMIGLSDPSPKEMLAAMFPEQVDPGARKSKTWTWMMSRIRDGNDVRPPRNLIDLALKAREAQLRRDERGPREHAIGSPLIESDALRKGLETLSEERVEDTLLAEAGDLHKEIELFRGGKAEHNAESLSAMLGTDWADRVKTLQTLGFLQPVGTSWKVPILYRSGLGITQGKAFLSDTPTEPEVDDEA